MSFQTQWIPRAENELADYVSRIVDPDDWILSRDLFKLITNMWVLAMWTGWRVVIILICPD